MKLVCVLFVILSLLKVGESAYLSFKKPTSSKSGHSKEATDGKDGIEIGCTHTVGKSTGEWLRVDLEKEYNITRVTVINRVEYGEHDFVDNRLVDAEVKTSSEADIDSAEKCGENVTDTESSPIIDFLCQKGTRGRYVFIWNPREEYLHICEMRVYNEAEPEINECRLTESGEDYRGIVSITKNGRVCQNWMSHTPHNHSVVQDPDKGIGDHNLCRNPDGKSLGPWCYTIDADTRWEYCDVGEMNEYCPLDSEDIPNPIGIVALDYTALLSSDQYSSTLNLNETPSCPTNKNRIDIKTSFTASVFTSKSFTLGFHFHSDNNSVGDIVRLGNTDHYLTITQTVSDLQFYHSEVTVYYNDTVLTRAFVLQPNVWTFIGVTFDGKNKNIKLWRNGEIASIGYTSFTNLEFEHKEVVVKATDTSLAMVQVYNEVLNEVAMKAARDLQFNKLKFRQQATLKKVFNNERVHGQTISEHNCRYLIQCSQLCLGNIFCEGFWYYTGRCTLLGCVQISTGKEDEILGTYYLKDRNKFI